MADRGDASPEGRDASSGRGPRLLDGAREGALRERLVARDEQALGELIDVASPWLLNIAQAMLQDQDEAEEVVMEAFRTLWQNVGPAEGQTGIMPYLMRVTRHRAIDLLRGRRRRERKRHAASWEEPAGVMPAGEPDEAGQSGWHVHTQIHSALQELPADQRAVVELAYFQGLSQSEIAAQLDVPLGTVKTRLRLAFVRLRGALAGLKDWVL